MDSGSGVGIDPEAHADLAAKYDSEGGWKARSESVLRKSDSARARKRARYGIAAVCGCRRGHGSRGSAAKCDSGVGVDLEAHANSAAKYDPEAGLGSCLESCSESDLGKSDSAGARKWTRYGIAAGFGVGRLRIPRISRGISSCSIQN